MDFRKMKKSARLRSGFALTALCLIGTSAFAGQKDRGALIITSSNDPNGNYVIVFKLNAGPAPKLTWVQTLPTGGKGGASGNAGILQFKDDFGVVANFGSNTVSEFVRFHESIGIRKTIHLAPDCVGPDSVALSGEHLFVAGANCAESHSWPSGIVDGPVVNLPDPSAAQIAVGRSWAGITMKSGTVLQLPLTREYGVLSGTSNQLQLPADADSVPLGAAFWGNTLGFTPAHSPDSFAIVNESGDIFPIVGPAPAFPTNAPCWVAKGPGNIWYTGNSPGHAISIFFSDNQGGVFYKSVPLPGAPTDITVSPDNQWLAAIYTVGSEAYAAVFAIDFHGDLSPIATSSAIGVTSFNGVAISQ